MLRPFKGTNVHKVHLQLHYTYVIPMLYLRYSYVIPNLTNVNIPYGYPILIAKLRLNLQLQLQLRCNRTLFIGHQKDLFLLHHC